jgi:hypothetical protein
MTELSLYDPDEDPSIKRAKHAEIKNRYDWHRAQKFGKWSPYNQRRSELRAIYRLRNGGQVTNVDLDDRISEDIGDFQDWSAESLGQAIRLTFQEYVQFRPALRTIRPYGMTSSKVEEFLLERRRESNRASAKRRRKKAREVRAKMAATLGQYADLGNRREALYIAIGYEWVALAEVIAVTRHWLCWQGPNGCLLSNASLSRAMRRAAHSLIDEGRLEVKNARGSRGQVILLLRRPLNVQNHGPACVNSTL